MKNFIFVILFFVMLCSDSYANHNRCRCYKWHKTHKPICIAPKVVEKKIEHNENTDHPIVFHFRLNHEDVNPKSKPSDKRDSNSMVE